MADSEKLAAECLSMRRTLVEMIHNAGSGHTGGSLSCVEIVWTLYSHVLRYRADEPDWPDRDRFILSKGHAAPTLYATLAEKGFCDPVLMVSTFRCLDSMFQGHPDMRKVPGIEMSTGSLGMGISVGVGMALAARLSRRDYRVFILVGDGELQEGQNWEALQAAAKYRLDRLTVIIDKNGVQLDGTTDDIMPSGNIAAKLNAFGLDVRECDGHDCSALLSAFNWACSEGKSPRAIVAATVKGKGIPFMEGDHTWHGKTISQQDYELATLALRGERA